MPYDLPTWVNGGPPTRNSTNLNKYTTAINGVGGLDERITALDAAVAAATDEYRIVNARTDYGFSPSATAAANKIALQAAIDAVEAGGGGIVYIPPGAYNCNGALTQGIKTEVVGAGVPATDITHPSNDAWMTALTPRGTTTGKSGWRNFILRGNSGASAKGIVFGNRVGTTLHRLMVRDYTAGTGIELQNSGDASLGFTEGTLMSAVHVRGCAKNIAFVKDATGHASFSDTTFVGVVSIAQAAGAVALSIGANADVYASSLGIKLGLENNTAVAMNVEAAGLVRHSSINIVMEGGAGNTRTGLQTASGSVVTGRGLISVYSGVVHSIHASSTVSLNTGDFLTAPAWIAPTLLNSWVNYGGSEDTAGYYKDSSGRVYLKGLIKSGTLSQTAFNLPAGYRPLKNQYATTFSNAGAADLLARVTINAAGDVRPEGGGNTFFSLGNVSFRAEQ